MNAITQRQALHLPGKSDFLCPVYPLHHASNDQRRLMLLSVSAGNGHVRAAQAIAAHAWRDFPQLRLQHIDMMQIVPIAFRKLYSDLYMKLASGLPEAWGWLYRKTDCEPGNSLTDVCVEDYNAGVRGVCSGRLIASSLTSSSARTFCPPSCWLRPSMKNVSIARSGYR